MSTFWMWFWRPVAEFLGSIVVLFVILMIFFILEWIRD
jgi:hypothetical protein